ncbi:putative bifunctional diguanylate cyclase/phosphodiesterase [Actinoplanes friuliensis]|uniref:Diguanylate cyclase/phosphodiesterase n=1 Tax=Actinoplanes friuliensis DSM 7358 TaxID=1246995 RepID=U5WA60_9ACTN|nr:EAL domain-containing protein [Actinoplanes friuliensis]AGZ44870.1 diguanylate cyclase/phosphodiesterase [Actinoplanes friuliensis DSM 7358]
MPQIAVVTTEQAKVERLLARLPGTMLGRVRLGAAGVACLSLVGQLGLIGGATGSALWDNGARAALLLSALAIATTYVRGRTFVWDPVVLPALITFAGSAFVDPIATIGPIIVLLVVQSLHGSFRSWAVRSLIGLGAVPAAILLSPAVGGTGTGVTVALILQATPQVVLMTAMTRAIYTALIRQELASAREAALARAGGRILAAPDLATVHRVGAETAEVLTGLSPDTVYLAVQREPRGLVVLIAFGHPVAAGTVLPEEVLIAPQDHLTGPELRFWDVEEAAPGRYRLLGSRRKPAPDVVDTFRTLTTQISLGEASRVSHAELDHRANHDNLTQLPTRGKFFGELAAAVDAGEPGAVALLTIDLDDFKQVNDVYGHGAGDELLLAVAGRITTTGGPGSVAGRLGGDEFVLLLKDLDTPATAERVATELCARLVEPVRLKEVTVSVGASIGVALTEAGVSAAELTRRADIAMYAAKARGKSRVEVFTSGEHGEVARHRTLEDQLPYAIGRGEIAVWYQPYLDLRTGEWAGVEALIEWRHPSMGSVPCRELLALAERTGDLAGVTGYFLRTVAEEIAALPGGGTLRLGINLSAHQLLDPRFGDTVLATLAECGLAAGRLTLEIVESEHIDDPRARTQLDRLAGHGVRIALDDFGTGYVSLASLRSFPIHQLKVDGSFLTGDPAALDLVLSVGGLLGTETVVQGVEQPEQLDLLRRSTATAAQGDLIAGRLDAAELAGLLAAGASPALWRAPRP